jgi:hypothetical protein
MTEIAIEISASDVEAISIPVTGIDVPVDVGPVRLSGWCIRETTGAAIASVQLLSGGNIIAPIGIPSGGTHALWMGKDGLHVRQNIRLHVIAGSVEGTIYVSRLYL